MHVHWRSEIESYFQWSFSSRSKLKHTSVPNRRWRRFRLKFSVVLIGCLEIAPIHFTATRVRYNTDSKRERKRNVNLYNIYGEKTVSIKWRRRCFFFENRIAYYIFGYITYMEYNDYYYHRYIVISFVGFFFFLYPPSKSRACPATSFWFMCRKRATPLDKQKRVCFFILFFFQ